MIFILRPSLCKCGSNFLIGRHYFIEGIKNVSIGNNVSLNDNLTILSTRAKAIIGDDVMFGPKVALIRGNHRIDVLECTMISISEHENISDND